MLIALGEEVFEPLPPGVSGARLINLGRQQPSRPPGPACFIGLSRSDARRPAQIDHSSLADACRFWGSSSIAMWSRATGDSRLNLITNWSSPMSWPPRSLSSTVCPKTTVPSSDVNSFNASECSVASSDSQMTSARRTTRWEEERQADRGGERSYRLRTLCPFGCPETHGHMGRRYGV